MISRFFQPGPFKNPRFRFLSVALLSSVCMGGMAARSSFTPARSAAVPPSNPRAKAVSAKPPAPDGWSIPERYRAKVMPLQPGHFPPKLIALTFDDGPDPRVTPQILAELRKYGARATFFVLGSQVERHPELLRAIVRDGHVVGNHSFSHPKKTTPEQALEEIDKADVAIQAASGRRADLFRPPYGLRYEELSKQALGRGYTVVLWSLPCRDVDRIDSAKISQIIINRRKRGDVVVMHDGPGHESTARALPAVLRALSGKGYSFVTVPEMLRQYDYVRTAQERRQKTRQARDQRKKNGAAARALAMRAVTSRDGTK